MKSYDGVSDEGVTVAVLERVAAHLDADVLELDTLAATIEPGVLEAFVASDAILQDSELRFRYQGCTVEVTGTGEISVTDAA